MILLSMLSIPVACNGDESDEMEMGISQERHYTDGPPEVVVGKIRNDTELSGAQLDERIESIQVELQAVVNLVYAGDLRALPDHVHVEKGLYVDVKAHRTHSEVRSEVVDPHSYLSRFFVGDGSEISDPAENPVPIKEVLQLTRSIKADVFLLSEDFCEIQLTLEDAPGRSYYLNNPVLIEREGRWYIYRMF